jgi:hypothetical protein
MTEKLVIDILAKDKSKQALSGVQKRLGNVKKAVFSLRGALVSLGAGLVVRSFVNVGKEVESLQVRFKFLFGSAEEGAKAFDNLAKFAGTVPFSLEEISRASGNLAVVSKDAQDLNRVLEITGNVAAVTGLDFETTSSQIQRAFSGGIGAADLFRERGVRALLGFKAGATVTAEETVARFEELFSGNGKFAGATNDLATTLEGTISMLGDKFFNFQKDVAEGFFDELKKEFGDLNNFLEDNDQKIQDIAESIGSGFATAITKTSQALRDLAPTFEAVGNTTGNLINGFNSLPQEVKSAGILATLLFGKKGVAIAGALALIVDRIQEIADVTGDLSIVDPNDLTNVDVLNEKLANISKEILDIQGLADKPLEITLKSGVELNASDVFNLDENEHLNQLINERNNILRILNNLTFEQSDLYSNQTQVILDNISSQKDLNSEQVKQQKTLNVSADMMESGARSMHNLSFAQEKATVTLQGYNTEMMAFASVNTRLIEEQLSVFEQFNKGFKDAMDKTAFEGFQKAGETAFNSLKKTMTDFVVTGKLDMKGFEIAVKRAIVEALIGQAVQFALDKATQMFKMKSIRNALRSVYEAGAVALKSAPPPLNFVLAGGVIAGGIALVNKIRGFEKGGRPPINQPSIVGEKGAELFVPDQAGTIIPNNKLGGNTNVNITIMANDTEGFDELLSKRRATVVNIINDALNSQGKEALI